MILYFFPGALSKSKHSKPVGHVVFHVLLTKPFAALWAEFDFSALFKSCVEKSTAWVSSVSGEVTLSP